MTAIVQRKATEAPPLARAGLLLPGLGHLLTGRITIGIGLLSIMAICAWAAVAGFPRLGDMLFPELDGRIAWHPVVSLLSWVGLLAGAWHTAYRHAFPLELSEEERNSNLAIFLRTFSNHTTGMFGLYGAIALFAFGLLTPLIAPYDPLAQYIGPKLGAPSAAHLLGTDYYGRDVLSRMLYGCRISLTIGFVAVGIAASIGTIVGATAGYFGGWVDRTLMWFVDMLLSLPRLVLLLAVVSVVRTSGSQSIFLIVVILGLTGWMGVSRIVRSQVLTLKQQDFIQAARALGYSSTRIVFVHLIPNALAPVIVYCSLAIGGTILTEAGLSFLGIGVPPPTPTWGTMVSEGKDQVQLAPWIATFPGLAIVWAVMSFNLLGDGLRDALDPKLRGR